MQVSLDIGINNMAYTTTKLMNHIERRAKEERREISNDQKNLANRHRANMSSKMELEHNFFQQ